MGGGPSNPHQYLTQFSEADTIFFSSLSRPCLTQESWEQTTKKQNEVGPDIVSLVVARTFLCRVNKLFFMPSFSMPY